ncbi:hypothetical protein BDQ17DRAFT_1435494 [Cyathus striatus]|nr:hypothetical protein BDQ17DRAFT_1435494 [Cyathus striatus]
MRNHVKNCHAPSLVLQVTSASGLPPSPSPPPSCASSEGKRLRWLLHAPVSSSPSPSPSPTASCPLSALVSQVTRTCFLHSHSPSPSPSSANDEGEHLLLAQDPKPPLCPRLASDDGACFLSSVTVSLTTPLALVCKQRGRASSLLAHAPSALVSQVTRHIFPSPCPPPFSSLPPLPHLASDGRSVPLPPYPPLPRLASDERVAASSSPPSLPHLASDKRVIKPPPSHQ